MQVFYTVNSNPLKESYIDIANPSIGDTVMIDNVEYIVIARKWWVDMSFPRVIISLEQKFF